MTHPYDRLIHNPVDFQDWKDILSMLPLSDGLTSPTPRGGKSRGAWPGSKITLPWQRVLAKVKQNGNFCVVTPGVDNVTSQLNTQVLGHPFLVRDGCQSDTTPLHKNGDDYYVQLSVQFLGLTADNVDKYLPRGFQPDARTLPGYNELHSGKPTTFILIWKPYSAGVRAKDPHRMTLQSGSLVPKADDEAPRLLVVVSTQNTGFKTQLKTKFKNREVEIETAVSVSGQRVGDADLHCAQSAAAIVVYIDKDGDSDHPSVFGHLTPPSHLFLVAAEDDEPAVKRMKALAGRLGLTDRHYFSLGKRDAITHVAQAVEGVLDQARQAKETLAKCKAVWKNVRLAVGHLFEEMEKEVEGEPEIVQNTILAPFTRKVLQASKGCYSSQVNPQAEFVQVATPLYQHAQQIYALNTDLHSTFWNFLDAESKTRLLAHCPTVRLFLYSNPRSMVDDIESLNDQASHYQHLAVDGVKLLVGDLGMYREAFGERVDEDVAFIQHRSGAWYRFFLSKERFGAIRLAPDEAAPLRDRLTVLGNRAKIGWPVDFLAPKRKFHFFRWSDHLEQDILQLEKCLGEVFPDTSRTGVHRILTFHNDGTIDANVFRQIVLSVENSLEEKFDYFKDEFGLQSIKYGSLRMGSPPHKGRKSGGHTLPTKSIMSGAEIPAAISEVCHDDSKHILIMHFDTDKNLAAFTEKGILDIRHKLYQALYSARGGTDDIDSAIVCKVMSLVGNRYMTIQDYSDQHQMPELLAHLQAKHAN